MREDVIAWDLDSTIANTLHRQPFISKVKSGEATWMDYAMLCGNDEPIMGTIVLMRLLHSYYSNYIITGRNECARTLTQEWLDKHFVPCDALIMRPDCDTTPNGEYKIRALRRISYKGIRVVLFVEDWDLVAQQISEVTGIPVLLVNPGYPETSPHKSGGAV